MQVYRDFSGSSRCGQSGPTAECVAATAAAAAAPRRALPWGGDLLRPAQYVAALQWLGILFLGLLGVVCLVQYLYCALYNYVLEQQRRRYPGAIILQRRRHPQVARLLHRLLRRAAAAALRLAVAALAHTAMALHAVGLGVLWGVRAARRGARWGRDRLRGALREVQRLRWPEDTVAPPAPGSAAPAASDAAPSTPAPGRRRQVAFAQSQEGSIRETVVRFDTTEPATRLSSPREQLRGAGLPTPNRRTRRLQRAQTPPAKVRVPRQEVVGRGPDDGQGHPPGEDAGGADRGPRTPQQDVENRSIALSTTTTSLASVDAAQLSARARTTSSILKSTQTMTASVVRQSLHETLTERFARKRHFNTLEESSSSTQANAPPRIEGPAWKRGRMPLAVRPAPPQQAYFVSASRKRQLQQERQALVWEQLSGKRTKGDEASVSRDGLLSADQRAQQQEQTPPLAFQSPHENAPTPGTVAAPPVNPAPVQPAFTFGSTAENTPPPGASVLGVPSGPTASAATIPVAVAEQAHTAAATPLMKGIDNPFTFGATPTPLAPAASVAASTAVISFSNGTTFGSSSSLAAAGTTAMPPFTFGGAPATASTVEIPGEASVVVTQNAPLAQLAESTTSTAPSFSFGATTVAPQSSSSDPTIGKSPGLANGASTHPTHAGSIVTQPFSFGSSATAPSPTFGFSTSPSVSTPGIGNGTAPPSQSSVAGGPSQALPVFGAGTSTTPAFYSTSTTTTPNFASTASTFGPDLSSTSSATKFSFGAGATMSTPGSGMQGSVATGFGSLASTPSFDAKTVATTTFAAPVAPSGSGSSSKTPVFGAPTSTSMTPVFGSGAPAVPLEMPPPFGASTNTQVGFGGGAATAAAPDAITAQANARRRLLTAKRQATRRR